MESSSPIGVIDSGSGGLSIWKEIVALLPNEDTIYIGDHKYLPYSNKSTTTIRNRVKKLIQFLLGKKAKLIVIACNTATVAGIDWYRTQFPQIPIIGVVPVVKTAGSMTKTKTIAILSTLYTAKSQYQRDLIKKFAPDSTVLSIGSSLLVEAIESENDQKDIINKELERILRPIYNKPVDVIVLGCTHFPFIKDLIERFVKKDTQILDSGPAVARQVERILDKNMMKRGIINHPRYLFYTTSPNYKKVGQTMSKLLLRSIVVLPASIT